MLLTVTTTHRPATDLGYLLHKNPARCQSFPLSFGSAHVFYPEATEDRCTAALLLDVDPVAMVRGKGGLTRTRVGPVRQRPALRGLVVYERGHRPGARPGTRRPLEGTARNWPRRRFRWWPRSTCSPAGAARSFLREVFDPLGYEVTAVRYPLDETFPDWGPSPYYSVTLSKTATLSELLTHLYVLIPVFDNFKHYYVGQEELEKLLKQGEGWLASHPKREAIVRRYLKHRPSLARQAIERLVEQDDQPAGGFLAEARAEGREESLEKPISLNEERLASVAAALEGVRRKAGPGPGLRRGPAAAGTAQGEAVRGNRRHGCVDPVVGDRQ